MIQHLKPSFLLVMCFTILFGIIYPGAIWIYATAVTSSNTENSLFIFTSKLNVQDEKYFMERPSNAFVSDEGIIVAAASNLAPENPKLHEQARINIDKWIQFNPESHEIPLEMVLASASGLDPLISDKAAMLQIPRISRARTIDPVLLSDLISANSFNLPFQSDVKLVNVVKLNSALDNMVFNP